MHTMLWHKKFWHLVLAGLLLTTSMYMLLPVLPAWLTEHAGMTRTQAALCTGLTAVGVFLPGAFTSFLTQRYRRGMVCLRAVLLLTLALAALCWLDSRGAAFAIPAVLFALRAVQAVAYGEARIVLGSTLVLDVSESSRRTGAGHAAGWLERLALAVGPALSLVLMDLGGARMVFMVSTLLSAVAWMLVAAVRMPFKTPDDTHFRVSLDRFFLPGAWCIALNLLPLAAVAGLVIASGQGLRFYSMMTCGFLVALLAQRWLYAPAPAKTEIVSGLLLVLGSALVLLSQQAGAAEALAGLLFGGGTGLVGARLLLCMVMVSDHCCRGTAISTFFLTCELGLGIGVAAGYGLLYGAQDNIPLASLVLVVVALILYLVITDRWFQRHRHR